MKWLHLLKHNTPRVHLRSHGTFHKSRSANPGIPPHMHAHTPCNQLLLLRLGPNLTFFLFEVVYAFSENGRKICR